jgi:DNA-binding beta-propeller fold protein YncE
VQPLILKTKIPLKDVHGRIDHMAIDLARKRLLVAELGNGSVDVVDLGSGGSINRIGDLPEPQGVAHVPQSDLIVVANGGDGSVRLYRAADAALASLSLGSDADNVHVAPASGMIVVGYGSGGLAIIDPVTSAQVGDIELPAHPEGFALAGDGQRAFVNLAHTDEIAVVDLGTRRHVASWRVRHARANFPIALDEAHGLLAVVFRHPARLALLDAANGSVREALDTCGDADDVFFDARRERLYVSCGDGVVDVFARSGAQEYRSIARVPTASGARTSLFVPEMDRLFVAQRAGWLGADAAILVYRPSP